MVAPPWADSDDRQPLEALTAALHQKVFADKGYLSKPLLLRLWQRGLHLITGIAATEELPDAAAGHSAVTQTVHYRDPLRGAQVQHGLGGYTALIPHQCPGPYSLLPGGNHPLTFSVCWVSLLGARYPCSRIAPPCAPSVVN